MSEDFVGLVKILIASGHGDLKRLLDIMEIIKQGKPVCMSDYKYVQNLSDGEMERETLEKSSLISESKGGTALDLLRIRLAEGKITIGEFRDLKKCITDLAN